MRRPPRAAKLVELQRLDEHAVRDGVDQAAERPQGVGDGRDFSLGVELVAVRAQPVAQYLARLALVGLGGKSGKSGGW